MAGEPVRVITRRELLAGVGAVGAAAIVMQETSGRCTPDEPRVSRCRRPRSL